MFVDDVDDLKQLFASCAEVSPSNMKKERTVVEQFTNTHHKAQKCKLVRLAHPNSKSTRLLASTGDLSNFDFGVYRI